MPTIHPDHNTEPGCYVSGGWGHYGTAHLIEQFGADPVALQLAHDYQIGASDPEDFEELVAIADEIEEALNDSLTAGITAGWRDGEFHIFADCGGLDTCNDETCGCWT